MFPIIPCLIVMELPHGAVVNFIAANLDRWLKWSFHHCQLWDSSVKERDLEFINSLSALQASSLNWTVSAKTRAGNGFHQPLLKYRSHLTPSNTLQAFRGLHSDRIVVWVVRGQLSQKAEKHLLVFVLIAWSVWIHAGANGEENAQNQEFCHLRHFDFISSVTLKHMPICKARLQDWRNKKTLF